ncbi:autotransporter outer membrane beta-barrel domain-containing protein [Aureimonas altamirensis]|uniref:autotransporter outer membrane beta-barrel domain-containing protein n=1 Tax=Aureimonas altamirensis TaxID=370622 RepID=UPI002557B5E4|nr:autotransporter domain-containing protein [Aureimonas altamirensis]
MIGNIGRCGRRALAQSASLMVIGLCAAGAAQAQQATEPLRVIGAEQAFSGTIDVTTTGASAYGAFADRGGLITLTDGTITTSGQRGYGILAGRGSTITSAATIVTTGVSAHGVQSGLGTTNGTGGQDGSSVVLTGATISTGGAQAYGLHAIDGGAIAGRATIVTDGILGFGAFAESNSSIALSDSSIETRGAFAFGLIANNDEATAGGVLSASNVAVVTSGESAAGAVAGDGGTILIDGGSIRTAGEGATALAILDGGTIVVTGATLAAGNAATIGVVAGQGQASVTLGAGTVATENNGTLMQVERDVAGAAGVVTLNLDSGSTSAGDIVDDGTKTSGQTIVNLRENARWTGVLRGVDAFNTAAGGEVNFTERAVVNGDLNSNGSTIAFSSAGGVIAGNVGLQGAARTTGGSIETPIEVQGDVAVGPQSVMGGNWSIAGSLASAGTITPGNSIGVVTIGGDLTLAQGHIYEVEIDATGASDLVAVGGTATLAGSVAVSPLGGYLVGTPYTILTAGSLGGTQFDGVAFTESYAFVSALLSYDATSVDLTIQRNGIAYASVAEGDNQRAVANALESLPINGTLGRTVAFGTTDTARAAFSGLSGEVHASVRTGLIEDSRLIRDAATDRIRAAFAGPSSVSSTSGPWESAQPAGTALEPAAWGRVFGSWGTTDANGTSSQIDRDTGGFLAGIDGFVTDDVRLGLLAGYSRSSFDVDDLSSSADVDSYHLGLYGGTQVHGVGLRGGIAYTWHAVEASRAVAFGGFTDALSADYDAGTVQVFGEAGYAMQAGSVAFEPFAGVAYVNLDVDGFGEAGGAAALSGGGGNTETTFSTLGVRASTDVVVGSQTVTLDGMLGWRHAFNDRTPVSTFALAGSLPFSVAGAPIASDAAVVEIGLGLNLSPDASLNISYGGQFGDGGEDHSGRATFSYRF